MKEHQRTDRLTLITIFLVLIVGAILITYRGPKLKFQLAPEEMLTEVTQNNYIIPVADVQQLLGDENTVFVDIRNQGEFVVNRIKEAINIPLPKILDDESLKLFEDSDKTYVLYGKDHMDANGVWMLLRQLGFENVKVLLGGYSNYRTDSVAFPDFYVDFESLTSVEYDLNSAVENQGKVIAEADAAKVKAAKEVKVTAKPAIKKKVNSAPALPPPPTEEEEEEEGC